MASKRNKTTKIKEAKAWKRDRNNLKVSDALCPICRGILMEPVSLPCEHVFCRNCFEETMQNSNLACPLCRMRIGSWLRRARKESRLVDAELWKAIKERFPQQIKNKLNGIEEDLHDGPEVIVSYPGEIRKEYELEKKKINEELRKRQDADMKASEELIEKIKAEEEYQKIVMEEKLKLDEAVARKLAEELMQEPPSTSKKLGPMDKFLGKSPSSKQHPLIQPMENFINKDYTCTVLRLDNKKHPNITLKSLSPILKKKMPPLQRIMDSENNSDSSDCFESEMRYFKPIDYKMNPPSHGSSPIKISPMKPPKNGVIQIMSPGGQMNFNSNTLESAFARISLLLPYESQEAQQCETPERTNKLKRTLSDDLSESPRKLIKEQKSKRSLDEANPIKKLFKSPRKKPQSPERRRNGTIADPTEDRSVQEKMDFELARKLHNELNQTMHNLRRKRQSTLDELVKNPIKLN